MTPIWAWARRELTRHRRAALALVLLIGISGAVVLTTAAGARRSAIRLRPLPRDEPHG